MTIDLSREQAGRLLLQAQGLTDAQGNGATVASVVHDCSGVQAQDPRQAQLGIRARSNGLTAADVEAAQVKERSVVRTWCMRGTLHYVTVADLSGLLSLFGPLFVKRGRRRLAHLGLDDDDWDRAVVVIRDALADDGPLTRGEVTERLLSYGSSSIPTARRRFTSCVESVWRVSRVRLHPTMARKPIRCSTTGCRSIPLPTGRGHWPHSRDDTWPPTNPRRWTISTLRRGSTDGTSVPAGLRSRAN